MHRPHYFLGAMPCQCVTQRSSDLNMLRNLCFSVILTQSPVSRPSSEQPRASVHHRYLYYSRLSHVAWAHNAKYLVNAQLFSGRNSLHSESAPQCVRAHNWHRSGLYANEIVAGCNDFCYTYNYNELTTLK